jgi:hypothetical protein
MPVGWLPEVTGNSFVITPAVVIRPILSALDSVNQSTPSDPGAIPARPELAVGTIVSVMIPPGVMRPILFALASMNQVAPSGPRVICVGELLAVVVGNSKKEGPGAECAVKRGT